MGTSPRFVREQIFGPAMHGTSFCRALLRDHPDFPLAGLPDNLQASGGQVLHLEKFLAGARPERIDLSPCAGRLPPDWRPHFASSPGEFDILIPCESRNAAGCLSRRPPLQYDPTCTYHRSFPAGLR